MVEILGWWFLLLYCTWAGQLCLGELGIIWYGCLWLSVQPVGQRRSSVVAAGASRPPLYNGYDVGCVRLSAYGSSRAIYIVGWVADCVDSGMSGWRFLDTAVHIQAGSAMAAEGAEQGGPSLSDGSGMGSDGIGMFSLSKDFFGVSGVSDGVSSGVIGSQVWATYAHLRAGGIQASWVAYSLLASGVWAGQVRCS